MPGTEAIEGFIPVAEGVELRYKILGNGPQTVIIPAAIYMEYVFEQLAEPDFTEDTDFWRHRTCADRN